MAEPKVRFKKENGESYPAWERKQIRDIFERVNERNNGQFDNTRWISVAKMYFQEPDKVTSNNIDTRTYVMRYGDMAFEGHPNSEYQFGRFVFNDIGDGVISELFPIYRHKCDYVLGYWKYAIKVEKIMAPIYRAAITSSGASSNKLSENDFLREYLNVPSLDEQKRLADFFEKVDELISISEKEIVKLQELKRGCLQKMFPREGESVPEVRFPGFTDTWEQRKLPEFVNFYNGLTYTPDNVREDGTLVLRSSNVKDGEIVDADNVYVNSEVAKSENVQVGDIIIVVRNGSCALIGKHAEIKQNMPNTVVGAFMSGMRAEEPAFVNALLDTPGFAKEIEKNMGATINQITGYMFAQMEFMVPSLAEQRQIGVFFRNLDNLITLHRRECEKYKELKKGLLQKMFI